MSLLVSHAMLGCKPGQGFRRRAVVREGKGRLAWLQQPLDGSCDASGVVDGSAG